MRTLIFIALIVGIILGIWYFLPTNPNKQTKESQKNYLGESVSHQENSVDITHKGETYKVAWIAAKGESISLYSNLEERSTSNEIVIQGSCDSLVSGGFYSKENLPIGLFISKGQKISESKPNKLLNGYLYKEDSSGEVLISTNPPEPSLTFALQTGPILVIDGIPLKLNLQTDEKTRRIVATLNSQPVVTFFVFYKEKSRVGGPYLAELPEILNKVQEKTDIKIVNAVNLDGGSHSSFMIQGLKLPEISRMGNYFCIK